MSMDDAGQCASRRVAARSGRWGEARGMNPSPSSSSTATVPDLFRGREHLREYSFRRGGSLALATGSTSRNDAVARWRSLPAQRTETTQWLATGSTSRNNAAARWRSLPAQRTETTRWLAGTRYRLNEQKRHDRSTSGIGQRMSPASWKAVSAVSPVFHSPRTSPRAPATMFRSCSASPLRKVSTL